MIAIIENYASILYDWQMISRLSGKIIEIGKDVVIMDVNSVGYKIHILPSIIKDIKINNSMSFFTHLAVREDAMELFGFLDKEELVFFEMLVGISGIGPKSAVGILSLASPETLEKAIAKNDTSYLTKVSGIGKKSAAKIVLELKDKISKTITGHEDLGEDGYIVDALLSLGYTKGEARSAIKEIPHSIKGTNDRIKNALKILSPEK